LLLGYSRESYRQGIKYIQSKAFESDIIIEEALRYRMHQKRLDTRKLLEEMQDFLAGNIFQKGKDAMFDLLTHLR
jgi:hypothetical protein